MTLHTPVFASPACQELLTLLLTKDKHARLANCSAGHTEGVVSSGGIVCYDKLRNLEYFSKVRDASSSDDVSGGIGSGCSRVPSLVDLCVRVVGRMCNTVAQAVAANGGGERASDALIIMIICVCYAMCVV